jgi:hypothetical protein
MSGQFDLVGGGGAGGGGYGFGGPVGGGGAYGRLQIPVLTGTISGTVGAGGILSLSNTNGQSTTLAVTTKGIQRSYVVGGGSSAGTSLESELGGGAGGVVPPNQVVPGAYDRLMPAPLNTGNAGVLNGNPGAGYLGYGGGSGGVTSGGQPGQTGAILINLTYQTITYSNNGYGIAIGDSSGFYDQSPYSLAIGNSAGFRKQGVTYTPKTLTLRWTTPGVTGFDLSTLGDARNISVVFTIVGAGGGQLSYNHEITAIYGGGGGGHLTVSINSMVSPIISAEVGAFGSDSSFHGGVGAGGRTRITINGVAFFADGGGAGGFPGSLGFNGVPGVFGAYSGGRPGQGGLSQGIEQGVAGQVGYPNGSGIGYGVNPLDKHGCGSPVSGQDNRNGAVLMTISYMSPSDYFGGNSVAIGNSAGQYKQASGAIAIGYSAGNTGQGHNAIAIGVNAGSGTTGAGQAANSVCIGTNSGIAADGSIIPAQNSVRIGVNSQIPGFNSVAIGAGSRGGGTSDGILEGYGSALGFAAGANERGTAVGAFASANGKYSTAIGHDSQTQVDGVVITGGSGGVAVGTGSRSYGNGLALGRAAVANDGQITLNANIGYLTPSTTAAGFFVGSIRNVSSQYYLGYSSNKEIAYGVITSDERLKTGIVDTSLGLDFVKKLRPVSFKWKNRLEQGLKYQENTNTPGVRRHEGFIAQEVKSVLDSMGIDSSIYFCINDPGSDVHDIHGIKYEEIIGPLTKAIQEQDI